MKNFILRSTKFVGLVLALSLLLNTYNVQEVLAAETRTIMTITPTLVTSDNRVAVTVSITYQESTGIFTGASVKQVAATTDVSNLTVEPAILSSDKKMVSVKVSYNYPSGAYTRTAVEYLTKSVP